MLTSPNNPTGTALPLAIAGRCSPLPPNTAAWSSSTRHTPSSGEQGTATALGLLSAYDNLDRHAHDEQGVRLRRRARSVTWSQLAAVVDAVRIVRLPYHLSSVTQAVAQRALAHAGELLAQVDTLRIERDALVEWLRAQGFTVADSDANFVLFGDSTTGTRSGRRCSTAAS